jgi:3-deoxy-D-manno-octulosonate 8-phosphate phosphatase (KDO 8-P phosphatase)
MARLPARRLLRPKHSTASLATRARRIALAIFDVDGVMTDGRIYLGESGEEMKAFNVLDGHGIKLLRESGIEVAILSGRRARCVERRAGELGIAHVIQGAGEKLPVFFNLLESLRLKPEQAFYMGDDLVDIPVLEACGLAFTVPDAPAAVKRIADQVTRRRGGEGAVRDDCETLMRLRERKSDSGARARSGD